MRAIPALRPLLAVVALAVGFAFPLGSPSAQDLPLTLTAFAINMNSGPRTATVDIKIEKWSTDAEREKLLGILREQKDEYRANQALLRELQRMPKKGWFRTPDRLSWDLRFARMNPLPEGGRQIILGTDRPVGFWEARNQPRTMDYPFTIFELRLNNENRGEGKMLAGTKITIENNNLVLENYGIQPVRLNEIKPLK
jgi:hypothetical protein